MYTRAGLCRARLNCVRCRGVGDARASSSSAAVDSSSSYFLGWCRCLCKRMTGLEVGRRLGSRHARYAASRVILAWSLRKHFMGTSVGLLTWSPDAPDAAASCRRRHPFEGACNPRTALLQVEKVARRKFWRRMRQRWVSQSHLSSPSCTRLTQYRWRVQNHRLASATHGRRKYKIYIVEAVCIEPVPTRSYQNKGGVDGRRGRPKMR